MKVYMEGGSVDGREVEMGSRHEHIAPLSEFPTFTVAAEPINDVYRLTGRTYAGLRVAVIQPANYTPGITWADHG